MHTLRKAVTSIRPYHVYVAAVGVVGTVLTARVSTSLEIDDVVWSGPYWLFTALLLVAELRPIEWLGRHGRAEVTASWTFSFALLLLHAEWAIVVTAGVGLIVDTINRKGFVRTWFNAAQMVISLAAAHAVLLSLDAIDAPSNASFTWLVSIALAGATAFILNGALTCIVLALHRQRGVWRTIREGILQNLSTDGMLLSLAPVFVILARHAFAAVPLLLLTAWAVYHSTVLAVRREHEATHDQLTGLANRQYFMAQAEAALQSALRRPDECLAVAVLDLDGFKEVNDLLGHHIGDRVLQMIAERLESGRRASDLVARLGGDEFAVLLRNSRDEVDAHAAASRLDAFVREPYIVEGFPLSLSGSFGVTMAPAHGSDMDTLLHNADVAMYRAKQDGIAVHVYSNDADRSGKSRMGLLAEVERAIEQDEFILHWQPKIDLATGEMHGAEALVRWQHPTLGLVPPNDFIPLAEHTDLMGPFTEMVLNLALRQAREWADAGWIVPVGVNGSARTLHDLEFPSLVQRLLERWGIPAAQLDLEITENTVMADPVRTRTVLDALRRLGVSLSIDDFGTGYSSLANLRDLPVSWVKIDKSFVQNMVEDRSHHAIVRSIVDLARNLSMGTVAEGVEDDETYELLRRMGCELAQGYYMAKPMPASEMIGWVAEWQSRHVLAMRAS